MQNFRLVQDESIALEPGVNLFTGANAQGKTSVLEAVTYLSTGRSFRTARDKECIYSNRQDEAAFAAIECSFFSFNTHRRLRGAITPANKSFWADGKVVSKLGNLWGMLNTVLFLPTDTELVRGSPAGRRSLLSSLLARASQFDLQTMQNYAAALRERNALLRRTHKVPNAEFDVFETQMAEYGARMMAARQRLVRNLGVTANRFVRELSGSEQQFEARHENGCPKINVLPDDEYEEHPDAWKKLIEELRFMWYRMRPREQERGHTDAGPHRADIALILNGRDARQFASQGEARTIVLALRLAEMELLASLCGEAPVLLLDDIMGELDQERARRFIHLIGKSGMQALITATDATILEAELPIQGRFEVASGAIRKVT